MVVVNPDHGLASLMLPSAAFFPIIHLALTEGFIMPNDSNQWPIPPPSGSTTASEIYPDTHDYYSSHFKSKGPQTYAEYLASLGATSATEALEAIMRRNRLLKGENL